MLRSVFAVLAAFFVATRVEGHFLFVHVVDGDSPRIELHFAESAWDYSSDDRMVALIANAGGWDSAGNPLQFERNPHAMIAPRKSDVNSATSAFTYGIMRRGAAFLLEYHGKGVSDLASAATRSELDAEILARPDGSGNLVLTVLFRGEPAPNAEIIVPMSGAKTETMSTNDQGQVSIPMPDSPLFSIRAMVSETRDGEHDGEAYYEVRHYTTLTVQSAPNETGYGDSMASAVLRDAYGCSASIPRDGVKWRGRIKGRFDGEDVRGTITHDGSTLDIAHPSDLSDQAVACFLSLEGIPSPVDMTGKAAHFEDQRSASKGVRVLVPGEGAAYEILDRRIKSIHQARENGAGRVDVLEWQDTEDNRFLPGKVMLTEFDSDGNITSVTILNSVYAIQDGVHVPQRYYGTRISGSDVSGDFVIEVSDLSVSGANASDSS